MCPDIGLPRQTTEIPRTGPLGPNRYPPTPNEGYQYLVARVSATSGYAQLTGLTSSTVRPDYLEGKTE